MPARCRKANAPKGGGAGAALDAVLLARRGQPACLLVEMSAPHNSQSSPSGPSQGVHLSSFPQSSKISSWLQSSPLVHMDAKVVTVMKSLLRVGPGALCLSSPVCGVWESTPNASHNSAPQGQTVRQGCLLQNRLERQKDWKQLSNNEDKLWSVQILFHSEQQNEFFPYKTSWLVYDCRQLWNSWPTV